MSIHKNAYMQKKRDSKIFKIQDVNKSSTIERWTKTNDELKQSMSIQIKSIIRTLKVQGK